MKNENLEIYISIRDNGDGSASIKLFKSKRLAELDQEREDGFAESCIDIIKVQSESKMKITSHKVTSAEQYFFEMNLYDAWNRNEEFLKEFFPNGFTNFTVEKEIEFKYIISCDNGIEFTMYTSDNLDKKMKKLAKLS